MVSILNKYKNDDGGVSPVIGVILLVAMAVALVALASVIFFNIGTDSSTDSADASIDFSQTSSGVSVQVVSNSNVDEFIILGPNDFEEKLSGAVGSSENLIGPEGQYSVIAVMEGGEEEVLLTRTVDGLDYSGVFIVSQNAEEGEVEAELAQQFDNIEDYDLSVLVEDEEESQLVQGDYTFDSYLLSQNLVNEDNSEQTLRERIELLTITTEPSGLEEQVENEFTVGERIQLHEMVNLCPGDEIALEDAEEGDVLSTKEITIETEDCNDIRQVAKYINGEIQNVELINLWNRDVDYFVFDFDGSFNPELPTTTVDTDTEDGTKFIATVVEDTEEEDTISGATVHLGNLTETTDSDGEATFDNVKLPTEEEDKLEAVAYADEYQPSDIQDIEIIDPEDNPQEEEFRLELKPVEYEEPRITQSNTSDSTSVSVSGGGGVSIATIGGGGGAISGGVGGSLGGGGSGSLYSFTGATGASTTTLSSSSPNSSSDEVVEFQAPQRVFNVQEIDDSLIPQGEEFRVDTTVTSTGEDSLQDDVIIHKSPVDESGEPEEISRSEDVVLPGGEDTNVDSQTIATEIDGQNWDEGKYNIYVSLGSNEEEYQSAGILNVFPEDRLDATVDTDEVDVDIDTDLEQSDRAQVEDDVTITISSDALDGAESATVDLFKNGQRVESQFVNSDLVYEETFEEEQYAQYHIGIQESQNVALLDTLVVTDVVDNENIEELSPSLKIDADGSDCLSDDIGTSGQFDCQVDIEDDSTVKFDVSNTNVEFDEEADGDVEYEMRFGDGESEEVTDIEGPVTYEFDTNNVHLVEFVVTATIDGEEVSDRVSKVVNAVVEPNKIDTRIINTDIDEENNIAVDIRNDRETKSEDVILEIEGVDNEHTVKEEITVNSETTVQYTNQLNPEEFTDEEVEGGGEVDIEVRLTTEDDTTEFREEKEFERELIVPETSVEFEASGEITVDN